jgi:tetratricopeptide (TPR) repeat protein
MFATRQLIATSVLLSIALTAGIAHAQTGVSDQTAVVDSTARVVEPTPAQMGLYEEASVAFAQGRYDDAIASLTRALEEGKVNILYVNLGRALFRKGRCLEAKEAYDHAQDSPYVAEPTREQVQEKILAFRAELEDRCPGEIMAACTPDALRVSIDNEPVRPCAEGPFAAAPGSHLVSAYYQGRKVVKEVTIHAMKRTGVVLDLSLAPTFDRAEPWEAAGLLTAGIGAALLGGSAIADAILVRPAIGDFDADRTDAAARADAEDLQSLVLGSYIAGGLMTATGLMIYLLAPESNVREATSTARVGVWLQTETAGVSWGARW